jgi:diguanylate cyclase (GGDEF)-like protein/PAS domain S-box-containing protein
LVASPNFLDGLTDPESGSAVPGSHVVEFYDTEPALVQSVCSFLMPSLLGTDAAMVIATPFHQASFDCALQGAGVDLDDARRRGQYVTLDAVTFASAFTVDGAFDSARFESEMRGMICRFGRRGGRLRVYGEIVAVLWAQGLHDAAIALEEAWNELAEVAPFSLFCAYPMHAFDQQDLEKFQAVCLRHSAVQDSMVTPLETQGTDDHGARRIGTRAKDSVIVIDLEGRISSRKESGAIIGWTAEHLDGRLLTETMILGPFQKARLDRTIRFLSTGDGPVPKQPVDLVARHLLGHEVPIAVTIYPIEAGEEPRFNVVVVETTRRNQSIQVLRNSEESFRNKALHDPLTGLPNRELFEDRALHALDSSRESSAVHAVLMIDVDNFKTLNDTLGHRTGDGFLIEVAHQLSAMIRPSDTAARLGGDEFALLAEDMSASDALHLAQRVVEALRRTVPLADGELVLTASVGIAMSEEGQPFADLLHHADLAMYEAKTRGGDRHVFFAWTEPSKWPVAGAPGPTGFPIRPEVEPSIGLSNLT